MDPSLKRKFGRVDLQVTAFAFGTAPIGNFLKPISEIRIAEDDRNRVGRGRALL